MHVRINQPRSRRVSLQINHAETGSVAGKLKHFSIGPNSNNHAFSDRQCLNGRVFRINRENVTVNQNEIRRRFLRD